MPTRRSSRATVRDKENAPKLKKPTKSKKASPPEPMEASSMNNDTGISSQDSVGNDSSFQPVRPKKINMVELFKDTAKKVKSGSSLTKPFVDKLTKVYEGTALTKRTEFNLALRRLLYQMLTIVSQINEGVKTSVVRNVECDRIFDFIIELMPRLHEVEMKSNNSTVEAESTMVEADSIVTSVLTSLTNATSSKSTPIRVYSCELIGRILNILNDDIEVADFVIDNITHALCERTSDSSSDVRYAAYGALPRLQNYRDPADPVIAVYVIGLETDESDKVRRTCIEHIGLNKVTLLKIIERCRDTKAEVRQAAYKRLASKVKLTVLKPTQIGTLLEQGLCDESELVRDVVNQLISAWLTHVKPHDPQFEKGTLVDFIHLLDPVDVEFKSAELALDCLLTQWDQADDLIKHVIQLPYFLDPNTLLPCPFDLNTMDDENYQFLSTIAYVWFKVFDHINKKGQLESDYMPSLPAYVELITTLAKKLGVEIDTATMSEAELIDYTIKEDAITFTLKYLLKGLTLFEVCDPHSRKLIHDLPMEIIQSLSIETFDQLAPHLFHLAQLICQSDTNQTETSLVKNWIEVLRETSESQTTQEETTELPEASTQAEQETLAEINIIKMKINDCQDELEELIQKERFMQAEIVKQKKLEFEQLLDNKINQKTANKLITNPTEQPKTQSQKDIGFEDNAQFTKITATKSVVLLCELLKRQKKSFEAGLEMFIQTFLHPVLLTLGSDMYSPLLQNRATECLALFCALSRPLAEQYFSTFTNVALNNEKTYEKRSQVIAIKAITDMALSYHGEMELNETIDSTLTMTQSQSSQSQIERTKFIHDRVGELLRDIYAKNERRLYGQTQSDEEEPLSYVVVKCITRLLFRGHCNETLMSMLTIYILTDGFNTDELRKDLYRLITKDDVVSALPKILKLVLSEVILRIPSIAPDQVLKMFGRLSNPVSLKKVYTHCNKDKAETFMSLPLDVCRSAVEVLHANPDHHHAFAICVGLNSFNCAVPIDQALSGKLDESEAESIVKAWKALVTTLETCQVKERRARKSLEEFHASISSLLRDYEQANQNKSKNEKPGKKRRSKPPSMDEEEQPDE